MKLKLLLVSLPLLAFHTTAQPLELTAEAKPIGAVSVSGDTSYSLPITIYSLEWSEDNDVTESSSGGGASNRAHFSDISILTAIDSLTPQIMHDVALGKFVSNVSIDLKLKNGTKANYVLENVAFVSTGAVTLSGAATPLQRVAFRVFDKVTLSTTDIKGTTTAQCWNLKSNSACQ